MTRAIQAAMSAPATVSTNLVLGSVGGMTLGTAMHFPSVHRSLRLRLPQTEPGPH
jgi:hypothetical protein